MSGRSEATLSNLPKANNASSNSIRRPGVHAMGGDGGRGLGTKALTFSPAVDVVLYRPCRLRFIAVRT